MTPLADPAAIDLEPYKEFTTQTTSKLIAAVEALRAKNKELGEAIASEISEELIEEVEALRGQLIWGFYEEETPEYQQGGSPHELHELVTAEECSGLVKNIKALRERVAELGKSYEQAVDKFDACRAALARRVEQDTGKLPHPPDSNTQEWHEWLIEQSDMGICAAEAYAMELVGALEDITKGASKDEISINQEVHIFRLAQWRWCQERARTVLAATPAEALEWARASEWRSIAEKHPPAHETVLFLCSNGDIYQGRGCYGMHEPWWCGHSDLNFGKVLEDEGLTVTHWKPREALAKLDALGKERP